MRSSMIEESLVQLLNEKFPLPYEWTSELMDIPLTSSRIGFNHIEMYELLMCVEREFSIYLTPEEVRRKGFDTVNRILNLLEEKCT